MFDTVMWGWPPVALFNMVSLIDPIYPRNAFIFFQWAISSVDG